MDERPALGAAVAQQAARAYPRALPALMMVDPAWRDGVCAHPDELELEVGEPAGLEVAVRWLAFLRAHGRAPGGVRLLVIGSVRELAALCARLEAEGTAAQLAALTLRGRPGSLRPPTPQLGAPAALRCAPLRHLRSLRIEFNTAAVSELDLAGAESLEHLTCHLEPLRSVVAPPASLRSLNLEHCQVPELPDMPGLTRLHCVSLGGLRALPAMPSLRRATLANLPALPPDLHLRDLPALERLRLSGCPRVRVCTLRALPALCRLELSHLPELEHLDLTQQLPALRRVELRRLPALATVSRPPQQPLELNVCACHALDVHAP